MWSKLRRIVRAHKFRLKMCGASQYKPNRSKSTSRTFDRGCVFVKACPKLIVRAHMQQSQQLHQQSSSQRVGALSLVPFCLGVSGHPSGSRQGHPRYTGTRSAGRPWVARTQFSTAVQCKNTANMVAERCRSRAGALAARALLTRVYSVMTGHRNEEPTELMHEDFQVHVGSDWVEDLLERKNTTGVIVRRGIEERVSTTSENNVYNIYVKPMSISTCSSMQRC